MKTPALLVPENALAVGIIVMLCTAIPCVALMVHPWKLAVFTARVPSRVNDITGAVVVEVAFSQMNPLPVELPTLKRTAELVTLPYPAAVPVPLGLMLVPAVEKYTMLLVLVETVPFIVIPVAVLVDV